MVPAVDQMNMDKYEYGGVQVCNLTLGGSGQLHASTALAPVPIHYETVWAVQPVPITQKPEKFPILRIEPKFLRYPSRSLVTMLTALFNLPEYHKP